MDVRKCALSLSLSLFLTHLIRVRIRRHAHLLQTDSPTAGTHDAIPAGSEQPSSRHPVAHHSRSSGTRLRETEASLGVSVNGVQSHGFEYWPIMSPRLISKAAAGLMFDVGNRQPSITCIFCIASRTRGGQKGSNWTRGILQSSARERHRHATAWLQGAIQGNTGPGTLGE